MAAYSLALMGAVLAAAGFGCEGARSGSSGDEGQPTFVSTAPPAASVLPDSALLRALSPPPHEEPRASEEEIQRVSPLVVGRWVVDMDALARELAASEKLGDGFWQLLDHDLLEVRPDRTVVYCGAAHGGVGTWSLRDGRLVFAGSWGLREISMLPAVEGKAPRMAFDPASTGVPLKAREVGPPIGTRALAGDWVIDRAAMLEAWVENVVEMDRVRRLTAAAGELDDVPPPTRADAVAFVREHFAEDIDGESRVRLEMPQTVGWSKGEITLSGDSRQVVCRVDGDLLLMRDNEQGDDTNVMAFRLRDGRLRLEYGNLPWVFSRVSR